MPSHAFSNAEENAPAKKFVKWFSVALPLATLPILMAILPGFHDYYFGVANNESSAVGALQNINSLEKRYAASHPDQGFACELSQLGPPVIDPCEPNTSFLSGHWSGYTFAITDCAVQMEVLQI